MVEGETIMVDGCGGIGGEEGEKNNGSQLWVREGRRWKRCGKVFFFPFLYLFSTFFYLSLGLCVSKVDSSYVFSSFFFLHLGFFMFIYIFKGFCQKKIIILEDSILSPYWIRFFLFFTVFPIPSWFSIYLLLFFIC